MRPRKNPKRDYAAHRAMLKQHGRHEKPNAPGTKDKLVSVMKRWDEYCSQEFELEGDDALREADPDHLKQFFQWLVDNNTRGPQQTVTLLQNFRVLKMAYTHLTRHQLDATVVEDVNNYIEYYVEGKAEDSPRPKPIPSGEDFVKMLHFHYARDTSRYDNERQRVQQAFLMIIHGSSGVRPSSTMRNRAAPRHPSVCQPRLFENGDEDEYKDSNIHEDEDEDEDEGKDGDDKEDPDKDSKYFKLRYRDLVLMAVRTKDGIRYMVRPKFRHFKGQTRRAQNKTFCWLDQDDIFTCPVAHLVALALHDEAFRVSSIRTAEDFFKLSPESGRSSLTFDWRADIRDRPILRMRREIDANEITDGMALKRLSNLGKKTMGYKQSLTWYCLRRMVLNAVDHIGSDEVRNQISGHLESRTYRAHYMDQQIGIDVIAAVKGHNHEEDIIRNANSMGSDADPNAYWKLSPEDLDAIENLPEMIDATNALRAALQAVRDAHGSTDNGRQMNSSLYWNYERARKEQHTLKQRLRTRWQDQRRQAYFEDRDSLLIEAQLGGKTSLPLYREEATEICHFIPERRYLAMLANDADDMRAQPLIKRIAAFDALAQLCNWTEPPPTKAQPAAQQPRSSERTSAETTSDGDFPLVCHKLQCLFCIGDDKNLVEADRKRLFCRESVMWDHVKVHLRALQGASTIHCPHPLCRRKDVILRGIQHLKNHAHTVHGVRLQKS